MTRHIPLIVLAVLLLPAAAWAQKPGSTISPVVGPADQKEKREQAPPALPGARAEQNPVAPSDRPTNDMLPNDALFDAINRGDIGVARDAIGRGADLSATNVLGLTPLELSIDLGRNDISFLLLSMRGASGGRTAPQQGAAATDTPAALTPAQRRAQLAAERQARLQAQRDARAEARAGAVSGAAAEDAPVRNGPAVQGPPLFAGNGGSPNPGAGFNGFGR